MPADEYFYIDPNNETVGPISWEVLQQLARAGVIADEFLTAPEGASDWMPFAELKAKEEARSKLPPVPGVSAAETISDTDMSAEYSITPVGSAVSEEVRGRPIQWQTTTVPTQSSRVSTAKTRPNRTKLAVALAVGALIFSFVPILSVPAAIAALILGIPRIGDPIAKVPAIIAVVLAGLSIPVAISSAISGVIQADSYYDRLEAKQNIEWVLQEMESRVGGEIQSGEHMQTVVQQWASIDVSRCPEDYQEVYGEMIEVVTELAFYWARNEDLGRTLLIFFENLIESFGGDVSGLEDARVEDEQLMRRFEQIQNKLRHVCAKYGVVT